MLKFTKDEVYLSIAPNTYYNNQNDVDCVTFEKWEMYFVPIDLDDVNIKEIIEILETCGV